MTQDRVATIPRRQLKCNNSQQESMSMYRSLFDDDDFAQSREPCNVVTDGGLTHSSRVQTLAVDEMALSFTSLDYSQITGMISPGCQIVSTTEWMGLQDAPNAIWRRLTETSDDEQSWQLYEATVRGNSTLRSIRQDLLTNDAKIYTPRSIDERRQGHSWMLKQSRRPNNAASTWILNVLMISRTIIHGAGSTIAIVGSSYKRHGATQKAPRIRGFGGSQL
ncbi:hypothetical protein B0O80DRAFT_531106 [Mortierella sp. GBAus27b]|nr:hypothetical protein B0O80DRAFT_531106 [Mortierella sp. GBAus27b]